MPHLLDKLSTYSGFRALLVGDYMLDQQVYGAAERLSPDAPVPVLHATRFEERGGGAANVALCLRGLMADVACFGVVGADREGQSLRQMMSDSGCDISGLLEDDARPTTIKRSLIGLAQHRHPQKMFRMDLESDEPLREALREALLGAITEEIDNCDVICLEDYNKGVCCEVLTARLIELCRKRGKPILVDPAAIEDFSKYRGATVLTPNRSEAELATGLDAPIDASTVHNSGLARRILDELDLDAVVLTLDRHGALLEERGGEPQLVPTVARSVYDVTGAGDMVLAALAAAVANGFQWVDAVRFANAAAGLEVEVFGAQAVPFAAIHRAILTDVRKLDGKVRTLAEIAVEVQVHRAADRRIVFTNGCFDVIHAGHVAYLREAKQLGDVLIVAVNSDEQVRIQKGQGRPIYPAAERMELLSELQCVDYVCVFDTPTVHDLLRALRPDVFVKGGDYRVEEINEYDLVQELGLDLRLLAERPGLGSTDVIERVRAASRD